MKYTPKVGDRIRIERDEAQYPSRGTWANYRGRTGTVTSVNKTGLGATEYGVVFGAVHKREDGSLGGGALTWFKRYELVPVGAPAPERHAQPLAEVVKPERPIANYTEERFPVAPWDTTGLPPRTMQERCGQHSGCAYRDDDPAYCWKCHANRTPDATVCRKCKATEAGRP